MIITIIGLALALQTTPNVISAANAAGFASPPSAASPWTPGSYVTVQSQGTGPQTIFISVASSSGSGTIGVYSSLDGVVLAQLPNTSISNVQTQVVGSIAASSSALYSVSAPPGTTYIAASSWSGGSVSVVAVAGSGSGGGGGSGGGTSYPGQYNSTAPILSNGSLTPLQTNQNGDAYTALVGNGAGAISSSNPLYVAINPGANSAAVDVHTGSTVTVADTSGTPLTPTAGSYVVLGPFNGASAYMIEAQAQTGFTFTSGTTLVVEASVNGLWVQRQGFSIGTGGSVGPIATSWVGGNPINIEGNCGGEQYLRVRCTALAGGDEVGVVIRLSTGASMVSVVQADPTISSNLASIATNTSSTATSASGISTALGTTNTKLSGGLPAGLDGSGYLKVHEQGTATVSGSLTSAGTVTPQALTAGGSGGVTGVYQNAALTNSAISISGSASSLYFVIVNNSGSGAANACIEFYNTSSVTVGSTTPFFHVTVPAGVTTGISLPWPVTFSTALYIAAESGYKSGSAPSATVDVTVGHN